MMLACYCLFIEDIQLQTLHQDSDIQYLIHLFPLLHFGVPPVNIRKL